MQTTFHRTVQDKRDVTCWKPAPMLDRLAELMGSTEGSPWIPLTDEWSVRFTAKGHDATLEFAKGKPAPLPDDATTPDDSDITGRSLSLSFTVVDGSALQILAHAIWRDQFEAQRQHKPRFRKYRHFTKLPRGWVLDLYLTGDGDVHLVLYRPRKEKRADHVWTARKDETSDAIHVVRADAITSGEESCLV